MSTRRAGSWGGESQGLRAGRPGTGSCSQGSGGGETLRELQERSRAGRAGLRPCPSGEQAQLDRRTRSWGRGCGSWEGAHAHPTHAGETGFTLCAGDTCAGRERVFTPEAGQALTPIRPLTPTPHLNCGGQKWLYRCGPHFSQPRS